MDYLHAVCDAHPELEHCRPDIRKVPKASDIEGVCDTATLPQNMRNAAAEVARKHRMGVEELIGHGREKRYVEARKEFITLCCKMGKTLADIARFMNGRDHSSVRHYYDLALQDAELQVAA